MAELPSAEQIEAQMEKWLADPDTIVAAVQNMKERAHFWNKSDAGVVFRAAERHASILREEKGPTVDDLAFAIGQAVTLDADAVRANPMMLHDAAKAVLRLLVDLGEQP